MTCATHTEVQSDAFCTQCGRALCTECVRKSGNSVYCEACLPAPGIPPRMAVPPYVPPSAPSFSSKATSTIGGDNPEAAFLLGLIPGVGAIYNGEYFKAAIHVLVFSMLMQLGAFLLTVAFYFYMPFEAYYSAKKRKLAAAGTPVETPIDRFHQQVSQHLGGIRNKEMWGGIGLIVLGGLYLLDSYELVSFHGLVRLWPLLLIAVGVVLLLRARESKEKKSQ